MRKPSEEALQNAAERKSALRASPQVRGRAEWSVADTQSCLSRTGTPTPLASLLDRRLHVSSALEGF